VVPYSCEDCLHIILHMSVHVTAVDLHVPLGCAVAHEVRADCMRLVAVPKSGRLHEWGVDPLEP
jgi:hypothetical protein